MKKFFRFHPDALLILLAIGFMAVVIGYYTWGINNVVVQANRALEANPPTQASGFDLQAASQVDFRGLLQGTSSLPTSSAQQ